MVLLLLLFLAFVFYISNSQIKETHTSAYCRDVRNFIVEESINTQVNRRIHTKRTGKETLYPH